MNDLTIFPPEDGRSQIKLLAKDERVWLSKMEMALLFEVSSDNVGRQLKNLNWEVKLSQKATTEEFSVVQTESTRQVKCPVTLCNLEADKTRKKGLMQQLFPSPGEVGV